MASHPLKQNAIPRNSLEPNNSTPRSYHNDHDHDDYSQASYSDDALSGGYSDNPNDDSGYDEYDDLNSEAQEYYNSGASELVTTVR